MFGWRAGSGCVTLSGHEERVLDADEDGARAALDGAEAAEEVERELHGLEGVVSASADPESRRVTVQWTDAGTRWDAIRGFLESIGYPPAGEAGEMDPGTGAR